MQCRQSETWGGLGGGRFKMRLIERLNSCAAAAAQSVAQRARRRPPDVVRLRVNVCVVPVKNSLLWDLLLNRTTTHLITEQLFTHLCRAIAARTADERQTVCRRQLK